MPSAKRFVLKDSPPEVREAAPDVEPHGRTYSKPHSQQPGGVRIEEVVLAMKLASLAITDDKPDTLRKVSKTNPWHTEALTLITGSQEEANKPLTEILDKHFNLHCDKIIDISGIRGRYTIDTQGYIAHNDEMIVVSFRCTTSLFDWLTNMSTTSSAWEPDIDIDQGHSGFCSCIDGCCLYSGEYKPRVHTGFYNNFLVTAPLMKEYVDPLLAPEQPPRKLYVVGHSLGAGIATMAACYFLTEFDWAELPHKLIHVTAGSPRAVMESMQTKINDEIKRLRPLDKAVICRIVRDKDVVPTVPPQIFGFRHLDKLVYITKDGQILVNPRLENDSIIDASTMEEILTSNPALLEAEMKRIPEDPNEEGDPEQSKYDKRIRMVPRALRDHMPDFYLVPLIKLFEREIEGEKMLLSEHESKTSTDVSKTSDEKELAQQRGKRKSLRAFLRNPLGRKKIKKVEAAQC